VIAPASISVGRLHGNEKRPPERRWRAAEGLTTRRLHLPMAGTHHMYPCPPLADNLPGGKERAHG